MALAAVWEPTPIQALAQKCPAYELLFGGGLGGGKSDFLLTDAADQIVAADEAWRNTGMRSKGRAILFRKEFPRLKDLIERAHALFPAIDPGVKWKENDHTFRFSSGYLYEFGHLEDPNSHESYIGREFSWLGIDQAEEIPEKQVRFMKLRVRSSDPVMRPMLRVRYTCNPIGRHINWLRKQFYDPHPQGFKVFEKEVKTSSGPVVRTWAFIPSLLRDNPHLGAEYEAELLDAPEHLRRALLDGDWDVVPDSFFGDVFDMQVHVIDPFEVPKHWEVFRAADWGSRAPACCLWIAIDGESNLIVVEELYEPGQTGSIFGKKIIEREEAWGWLDGKGFSKLFGYIDHQGRQQYGSEGPTPVEAMQEMGIAWFDADKERKAGWVEIRRRLMERGGPAGRTPGLRIFRNCRNLIRTLPNLVSKEGEMDDIDSKQEDHAADALRYGCMSRPMARYDQRDERALKSWEQIMANRSAAQQAKERSPFTGY